LQQAVLNAADPAEMAYRMAKQGASLLGGDERRPSRKTIERIEKNLNSPRTPTAKGGEISPEGMTIEKLLEMPQDEFSRVWDSLTTAQRRKLCEK
jgi:hypothetical protein